MVKKHLWSVRIRWHVPPDKFICSPACPHRQREASRRLLYESLLLSTLNSFQSTPYSVHSLRCSQPQHLEKPDSCQGTTLKFCCYPHKTPPSQCLPSKILRILLGSTKSLGLPLPVRNSRIQKNDTKEKANTVRWPNKSGTSERVHSQIYVIA